MLLKLLSFLMIFPLVYGYGSGAPESSPRPRPRPDNLEIVDYPKDGEIRDGKVRLSVVFPNDGVYYQRDNHAFNIPIMHYFKNEYPDIDLTKFRIKRMNINSRGYSDYGHLSFHSKYGQKIKGVSIPVVAYPGEPLGEYSQTIVLENEINFDFSYISVAGVIGVNNFTIEMEKGTPNFTLDTTNFRTKGEQVLPISGLMQPAFNETRFAQIMEEVTKMNTIGLPEEEVGAPIDLLGGNNEEEVSTGVTDSEITVTTLPPIEQEETREEVVVKTQLAQFPQRTISVGRLKNRGAMLNIQRLSGRAKIVGFHVTFRDGTTNYQNYNIALDNQSNSISFKLSKNYSYSSITLYFANVSNDGEVYVDWWEN